MKWTGLNELREAYLSFFESKGHLRLGSFPLIPPADDKSLLLINSGMAPMKKWFLGQAVPPRKRVTTCQKCIRTPDIENVGITARHGCFFEMLGNFSFGDYFKIEATAWAWEFFTKVLEIPEDLLYVSVYVDDDEAYDIWTQKLNVDPAHMVRFGKEDNFWEHGSGPCGPCSEIYFDRGPSKGCGKPDCKVGCECDRFIEVWNLVFSQYDSDGAGTYTLLENPNIDTGMGLERLACVMQGVDNLFEVDTVRSILDHVCRIAGITYGKDHKTDVSVRAITDHIRATTFMVGDGVLPGNAGRGYVLRRLLRRAARHGRLLGIDHPFLVELIGTVIENNGGAYPELVEHADYIKKVIGNEETSFYATIDQGMNLLNSLMEKLSADGVKELPGDEAFKLHDTFGFPLDLTREIAAENGFTVDEEGFKKALQVQKETAKADHNAKAGSSWNEDLFAVLETENTEFVGYQTLTTEGKVLAAACDGKLVEDITNEDEPRTVLVVLDRTSFYAESGGQVADVGTLSGDGVTLKVTDVKKNAKGLYIHTCTLEDGVLHTGMTLTSSVCRTCRMATARNHTAAHLLQAALRKVLGDHVHQAGQLVSPREVRFDFTHFSAMTAEELAEVERLVNEEIFGAVEVSTREMPIEEAKAMGAMALFGEKYGDVVRVVDVPEFSREFCGGTHVANTAQIGCLRIVSESSVAAGVRRIEAVTGAGVIALLDKKDELLKGAADSLKANNTNEVALRAAIVMEEYRALNAELNALKAKIAAEKAQNLFGEYTEVSGVKVSTAFLEGVTADDARSMIEKARDSHADGVLVLIGEAEGKLSLVVGVGADAVKKGLAAGKIVREVAAVAGGKGGGRPDIAMAGIKEADKVKDALNAAAGIVAGMVK
ncbi:MAG: alanine--tRNA ligase [Oscillospiraceae bacterium]|nr:alanine--tRNA ligase [Oscillospiraceae bacterium]